MQFDTLRSIGQKPAGFSLLVIGFYVLLILPMAASRDFDLSVFVLAGEVYVDHAQLASPLRTVTHSYGYDGQFFYRLARAPFSVKARVEGVRFDVPPKRMQRIVYPFLAWLVSLGRSAWVPASLVLVNLAALGAIAASTAGLARRHPLAWWFPFAVAGWPGFLIALTHDTAEIVAAAFCLAALAFYMSDRIVAYCAMAAAATLTRETTIPVVLGPLIYESWKAVAARTVSRVPRVAWCALALAPFAIWHEVVGALWSETAQPLAGSPDLGLPLVGVVKMLLSQVSGGSDGEAGTSATFGHRVFVVATTLGLMGFCAAAAIRLPHVLGVSGAPGVAIGWGLDVVLMSLLTASGPWVGPQGYFRAFTECWIVGCLLLALSPTEPAGRTWRLFATLAGAEVIFLVWKLCFGVLPV